MSKFCPDTQCDFWEDFPDGLGGKKAKICPYCFQKLLTEKPVQNHEIFLEQKETFSPASDLYSYLPEDRDSASEQEEKLPITLLPEGRDSTSEQEKKLPVTPLPEERDSASEQVEKLPVTHLPKDRDSASKQEEKLPVTYLLEGRDSASEQEEKLPITHLPEGRDSASEQEEKLPVTYLPEGRDSASKQVEKLPITPLPEDRDSASKQVEKLPITPLPEDRDSASEQEEKLPITPLPEDRDSASKQVEKLPITPLPEDRDSASEQEEKLPITPLPEDRDSASKQVEKLPITPLPEDRDSASEQEEKLPITYLPEDRDSASEQEEKLPVTYLPEDRDSASKQVEKLPITPLPEDRDSASEQEEKLPITYLPEDRDSASEQEEKLLVTYLPEGRDSASEQEEKLPVTYLPEDRDSASKQVEKLPITPLPEDRDSASEQEEKLPITYLPEDRDSASEQEEKLPVTYLPEDRDSASKQVEKLPITPLPEDRDSASEQEEKLPITYLPEDRDSASEQEEKLLVTYLPEGRDSASEQEEKLPVTYLPEDRDSASKQVEKLPITPLPEDRDSASEQEEKLPITYLPEDRDSASEQEEKLLVTYLPEGRDSASKQVEKLPITPLPEDRDSASEQEEKLPITHLPGGRNSASEQEEKLPVTYLPKDRDSASKQVEKLPTTPRPEDRDSASDQEDTFFDLVSTDFSQSPSNGTFNHVTTNEIRQSHTKSDPQVEVHEAIDSSQADNRKRGENENSQNSDPSSRSRKSKRTEDKHSNQSQHDDQSLHRKFGIHTEIDPNETSYVNIQFITLILKEYWKKIDAICLRIGHRYFGDFNTSIVPFNKINTVKLQCGKFVTVSGTLRFPVNLIYKSEIRFPYKYFIYSKDNNASYEQLHHSYNNYNRYLIWNTNNPIQPLINGSYQQFDTMILPEIRKKEGSTFWNIVNTAISFVGASGGYDKDIPFHKIGDRRLVSLQTLLPSYLGLGHSQPCSTMEDFITHFNKQILMLVYFSIQCVGEGIRRIRHWDNQEQVQHDHLIQLVEAWIMNTFTPERKSQLEKKHVVYMFYIGCYLIDNYRLHNNELNLKLVNMIEESIEPILKNQYFLFDNTICIHQQFGIELHNSIFNFIFNKAILLTNQHDFFLTLIPIYHGINNMQEHSNTLHEELEYTENNYWGLPNEVTIYLYNIIPIDSIHKALSLTKYDQIIPYTVVIYALNENNVNFIYEQFIKDTQHFPLSALMAALLFRFNHTHSNFIRKDDKLRTEVMKALNTAFTKDSTKLDVHDVNRLTKLTFIFASKLPIQCFNQEQFNLCLSLLSQGLGYCDYHFPDNPLVPFEKMTDLFNNFVKRWFSDRVLRQYGAMYYGDYLNEIKFWEEIISKFNFPKKFKWLSIIENFIVTRFRAPNIPQQFIIDLFIHLHTKENYSHLLQEIFLKELTSRLQTIRSGEKNEFVKQLYLQLSQTGQLKKVNNIFSDILINEEDNFNLNPIIHFVTWTSWDTYFSFLTYKNIDQFLSIKARNMLQVASTQFFSLFEQINAFEITGLDLELISKNRDYFLLLTRILLKSKICEYSVQDITIKLGSCLKMYNWILEQIKLLGYLNEFLDIIHNVNNETLNVFLSLKFDQERISNICFPDRDSYTFPNSPDINTIITFPQYASMCKACKVLTNSRIIIRVFDTFINEKGITMQTPFEIKRFYEEIWKPALDFCINLLNKFNSETILISEMCKYFDGTENLETILNDLVALDYACTQIQTDKNNSNNLHKTCAKKIHLYFDLQRCSKAASLIIKLKNELLLASNFEIIENMKNIKHTFENKQLMEVNEKVIHVAINLTNLSKSNLDVIQAIIDRIDFIMWIRNNLKDLNELKTFVDISLTTCGGNPVDVDRITCLSSVCTNFAPIIFQIDENTNYETLIARCRQVIESVERNKELTKLLRQVGENVTFWEEMKRSHGSVEETTLMQLDSIMNSGVFLLKVEDSLNLCDILSLSVDRENGEKRIFTLEQLREFRSKIMLVVSKTELPGLDTHTSSYENSQIFTHKLDTITEIATIVIQLAETGNQRYLNYELFSDCNQQEDTLMESKMKLKATLGDWKLNVEEARNKHYFLNYYTISQIVFLQKGIQSFIEDREDRELEQLYHLLGLLNPDVSKQDIQQALAHFNIIPKQNPTLKASYDTTHDFSKESLSTAISTHYSHIGPTKSNYIPPPNLFSCPNDDNKTQIPDSFSSMEKDLAHEVSEEADLPLKLVIRGIIEIKKENEGILLKDKLLTWCLEHEADSDTESIEDESIIDCIVESLPNPPTYKETPSFDTVLDFYQLGSFLEDLYQSCVTKIRAERELPYSLKKGTPNLIVIPSNGMLEFVLSLYMSDNDKLPLPYYHEILICTHQTKLEEIEIFWRRAVMIPDKLNLYLFCLIGVENLSYHVAVQAVSKFKHLQQSRNLETTGKPEFGYKLLLICSEEKEGFSHMAAAFDDCKILIPMQKSSDIKEYLTQKLSPFHRRSVFKCIEPAWMVDKGKSRVRLVVSDSVGAGKSLYINNLKSDLFSQGIVSEQERDQSAVTVAIHGKKASEEHLAEQLLKRSVSGIKHGVIYHVDIASTVQLSLEPILFKLLILGGVCKRSGELWHCRGRDYYVIEMTLSSVQNALSQFTRIYPNIQCIQAFNALTATPNDTTQTIDLEVIRTEHFQRVGTYLKELENSMNLDTFIFQPSEIIGRVSHINNLNIILKNCGIVHPSWAEVRNFVSFLDKQLLDCDNSDYCQSGLMGQDWKGFRSFVVKFMILMSRDFATPSLKERKEESSDFLTHFEIIERRKWESNSHPYIFFNPDRHTMTFLGFHISKQGHLVDSDNPSHIIETNIMHHQLFQILTTNRVNLQEDFNQLNKIQKIMKIAGVMGIEWLADPDPGYVLTLDNMRKILAILMRFRCNIPVVIMGETGCGKTRLIQFMCSLEALQTAATNMLILKVHGGTTETDVMCKVEEAERLAERNYLEYKIDTVLFFDEANTSPAIGLIKEIMCDRRMYGRHIRTDIGLQFIAACNPYRKHTEEMLNKLSSAGLGFFTKASETTDRLGDIPLRELVYRVMELPASLRPLVWDFGQLSNSIEKTYTREIVAKHLRDRNSPIEALDDVVDVISDVLASSQSYMRERKDECSFVSLRDVERAMRVMLWFYSKLEYFRPEQDSSSNDTTSYVEQGYLDNVEIYDDEPFLRDTLETPEPMPTIDFSIPAFILDEGNEEIVTKYLPVSSINSIDPITYSLIISLAVCYRARLQERDEFDQRIVDLFKYPLTPIDDYQIIHREVDRCQKLLLDEMTVGANIAKNTALKENVFMMFVCIELKIPLFVIGKPGSSKSLAKSIISNSMQGSRCPDGSILQNFKQVQIMSYQCSQLSTADGIIGVFKSCRNLQLKTGSNKFTACVVLDEVGLAEDSPLLPLKVLHPLLEDSSYGSEEVKGTEELDEHITRLSIHTEDPDQPDEMSDHVAFIGISNWSLDPAKMNRGIMLARGDPNIDELITSAKGICQSTISGPIIKSIDKRIPFLAKAYLTLTSMDITQKDSTRRDYYGLRDFYSLVKMLVFICSERVTNLNRAILEHAVKRNFGGVSDVDPVAIFLDTVKLQRDEAQGPDSSPLGLIRANLVNLSRSFHGETRYLLLLTENYAALNILLRSPDMWPKQQDIQSIRVIFGSSFPSDQEYSAVCRNINRIKVCMESGKTVILLNLENLYESLYDALNQYYMEMNNQRYVDLGLGTHRMKCRVHNEFKLIVVADKDTVRERFPTPLINRLEKHILTMSTVLTNDGVIVSEQLAEWAKNISTLDNSKSIGIQRIDHFGEGNCFIGYHSDTPYSIVFHVMKEMYPDSTAASNEVDRIAVLERSQTLLLRMATTDAVLRVKNSFLSIQSEQIITEYFRLQLGSLEEYLSQVLSGICRNETGAHLSLATTHSRLLTERDIDQLQQRLCTYTDSVQIRSLSLQQFQTEQQYTGEIQKFLRGDSESETRETTHKKILLVQCERGAENVKLIACARHKTVDELKDWGEEQRGESKCEVFLLFLVQLSREAHGSKFLSFCGGDWNTVHIDDIRCLDYTEMPPISQLIGKQIYEIFGGHVVVRYFHVFFVHFVPVPIVN